MHYEILHEGEFSSKTDKSVCFNNALGRVHTARHPPQQNQNNFHKQRLPKLEEASRNMVSVPEGVLGLTKSSLLKAPSLQLGDAAF